MIFKSFVELSTAVKQTTVCSVFKNRTGYRGSTTNPQRLQRLFTVEDAKVDEYQTRWIMTTGGRILSADHTHRLVKVSLKALDSCLRLC